LGGIIGAILFFVWLCTLRGDRQYRKRTGHKPSAPGWARLLFVLFVGGLLMLCLAPGIMPGLGF
jgi:hypothetical protein